MNDYVIYTNVSFKILLAMIDLPAVQSSTQRPIDSAVLFIDIYQKSSTHKCAFSNWKGILGNVNYKICNILSKFIPTNSLILPSQMCP